MPSNPPSPVAPVGTRERIDFGRIAQNLMLEAEMYDRARAAVRHSLRRNGGARAKLSARSEMAVEREIAARCVRAIAAMQEGRVRVIGWSEDRARFGVFGDVATGEEEYTAPDALTAIERAASPASREGGADA